MRGLFLFLMLPVVCAFGNYEKYLEGRIVDKIPRKSTYVKALELMEARQVKCIIETGTTRTGRNCYEEGCGTWILADWARDHGATVYSVDIDPDSIKGAAELFLSEEKKGLDCAHVHLVLSDSVEFLKNFGRHIDFLYLDSYDIDYKRPYFSQTHHLAEIKASLPWISENTIILIDDCIGKLKGKGGMVIGFLEKYGWVVIERSHQILMVHSSTL